MSFIDLALWCVQEDPINRQLGSMKLVINKLQRLVEIYSTKLPTVDKLTSSPLSVSIHPCTYPSTQVELDTY